MLSFLRSSVQLYITHCYTLGRGERRRVSDGVHHVCAAGAGCGEAHAHAHAYTHTHLK